ncbi:MAG: DNA translocase FtsK [Parachlamydiaceae bacterium]
MAKKSAKKAPAAKKREMTEIHGLFIFASALIILLSLVSFSLHGNRTLNWIGATGNTIGWGLTAVFGLGSYLLAVYLAWIGWRLIFRKPINQIALKTVSVFVAIFSSCVLLSVLEDSYPDTSDTIQRTFYQGAWGRKLHYHLGGAPTYYLYHDLPYYNLRYLLNTIGVTILFTCSLVTSLLILTKINFFGWVHQLVSFITGIKWSEYLKFSLPKSAENEVEKIVKPVFSRQAPTPPPVEEPAKESDFLRYVKLRIPSLQNNSQTQSSEPFQHQNEMLAIKPESNPKSRPSLSRKEQTDNTAEAKALEMNPPKVSRKIEPVAPPPMPSAPIVETPKVKDLGKLIQESKPKIKREIALAAQRVHNGDFSDYKLPTLNLLTNAKKLDHSSLKKDLKRKAEVLEETLLSFGIEAKVGQINCGPTITSFEVHPAIGVKVQKIKALENDIALNMEAQSIRIIAPIPGKAAVGIEVPNAQAEEVGFKEMLSAYQQAERKFRIPILLGKAVNGDYVMSDLTKMPHCIIAGATGSGKSVCINTIVMSILLNAKPDEIKLVMVDPKKVELTPYTRLPHMLSPVITEPQGACAAMNWLVKEMEKRYELLKQLGVRNIDAFNTRTLDKEFEASLKLEIPEKLPYIVGIIDELADLMMASSSDIETPIARIAQMARAVGIHLILATQRPSREVITGLIKANFPTRISFKVSSRVNSQIILDDIGAESLLGNGDMLFLPPGASHLVRAQGAFIRDEDINAVIKMITDQAPPNYVIESFDRVGHLDLSDVNAPEDTGDALYTQALDVVLGTGNASTTFLQRKLKIGYARAASLIDLLEQKGIVGPADGSKARRILAGRPGQGAKEEAGAESDLFAEEEI